MITIFFEGGSTYTLPASFSNELRRPRSRTTRTALPGNEIQQYAAKSQSSGVLTYDQLIKKATCEAIEVSEMSSGTCFISDGKEAWEAVIDIPVRYPSNGGGKRLNAVFYIVRRVPE